MAATRTEKLIADAIDQSREYADELLSQMREQLAKANEANKLRDRQIHVRRLINHVICLVLGAIVTMASLKFDWSPIVASAAIPAPSFIMEAIDRIKLL